MITDPEGKMVVGNFSSHVPGVVVHLSEDIHEGIDKAANSYGVVIDENTMEIDHAKTEEQRARLRASHLALQAFHFGSRSIQS